MKLILNPFVRFLLSLIAVGILSILCSAIVNENTINSKVHWDKVCKSTLLIYIIVIIAITAYYNYLGFKQDAEDKIKEKENDNARLLNSMIEAGLITKAQETVSKIETGSNDIYNDFNEENTDGKEN